MGHGLRLLLLIGEATITPPPLALEGVWWCGLRRMDGEGWLASNGSLPLKSDRTSRLA